MGTALENEQQNFKNCINMHDDETYVESKEQYDNYGNIEYYYKRERTDGNKIIIYNADQREIGSIRIEKNCFDLQYILTDTDNNITNYINIDSHCCSGTYSFLDSNKNLEGVINENFGCKLTYEEFDNYNTRISTADTYLLHNGCPIYNEYDQYENIAFRTKINYQRHDKILKIFDSNDNEINFNNKNLINKGFTKIQMIFILRHLFI